MVVLVLIVTALIQLIPLPVTFWRRIGDGRGTLQERAVEGETLLRSDLYRTEPLSGRVLPEDAAPVRGAVELRAQGLLSAPARRR